MEHVWRSPDPDGARAILDGALVPWWIAGGWAITQFVGRVTRDHSDMDVGCLRRDAAQLLAHLPHWDVRAAVNGALVSRASREVPPGVHTLWCRPAGTAVWVLEILIEDSEGPDWVYRRDRAVRLAAGELVLSSPGGIAYLRPEVQLLYKSTSPRKRDEHDFRTAAPRLDAAARAWLVAALRRTAPDHAWLPTMVK